MVNSFQCKEEWPSRLEKIMNIRQSSGLYPSSPVATNSSTLLQLTIQPFIINLQVGFHGYDK
jgi:hypothetical protein